MTAEQKEADGSITTQEARDRINAMFAVTPDNSVTIKFQAGARGKLEARSFWSWLLRFGVEGYQADRVGCERGPVQFVFDFDATLLNQGGEAEVTCIDAPSHEPICVSERSRTIVTNHIAARDSVTTADVIRHVYDSVRGISAGEARALTFATLDSLREAGEIEWAKNEGRISANRWRAVKTQPVAQSSTLRAGALDVGA